MGALSPSLCPCFKLNSKHTTAGILSVQSNVAAAAAAVVVVVAVV